jgi:hypothetical protein
MIISGAGMGEEEIVFPLKFYYIFHNLRLVINKKIAANNDFSCLFFSEYFLALYDGSMPVLGGVKLAIGVVLKAWDYY